MYMDFFKKVVWIFLLNNMVVYAEVGLQEGIYDAAKDMMEFDEKINRLIDAHNQIDMEEDEEQKIEDFEETEIGYVLKTPIDENSTKVEVRLKDRVITISTTTTEKEVVKLGNESSYETTISSSATSLFLPQDADEESMQKHHENGVLEVTFLKKQDKE